MSEIIQILQGALPQHEDYAPLLLKALEEQQLQVETLDTTVTKINSLLNAQATKGQAYILLINFLPHCSPAVLDEKGLVWINIATKTCALKNQHDYISLAYDVIRLLIEHSLQTSEFHKQISHTVLQKIFEAAFESPEDAQFSSLNCLIQCMLSYPGPCGPSKNIVEKIALKHIDSSQKGLTQRAGLCLLLMQQTRSGGEAGTMHKKYFTEYHVQIIGSLHHYLNILLENVEENYDVDEDSDLDKLRIPELQINHAPVIKIAQISQRILNLLTFLKEALRGPYPVPKIVRPNQILALLRRGLEINPKSVEKYAILDNLILATILSQLHVAMFDVLNAFIDLLQGHSRLFCNDILSLLDTALKWSSTEGKQFGKKKMYSELRSSAFKTLKLWCTILGGSSLIESISDTVVQNIIEDTLPYKSEVTLQVHMNGIRNLSKRAKKKLQKSQNESTNLAQQHSNHSITGGAVYTDEYNTELCVNALEALSAFLQAVGYSIKPTLQRTLQQHIVQLCVNIHGVSLNKSNLYFPEENRIALYKSLSSIIMYPHHLSPPPLQYGILLLTNVCNQDQSQRVREICRTLLCSLDKIIHPQRSVPYFEPSFDELSNAIKNLRGDMELNDSDLESEHDIEIVEKVVSTNPAENDIVLSNITETSVLNGTNQNNVTLIDKQIANNTESIQFVQQSVKEKSPVDSEEIIDVEDDDQDACMIVDPQVNEDIPPPKVVTDVQEIPSSSTETEEIVNPPPEKRLRMEEEDILVDQLAETFVPE